LDTFVFGDKPVSQSLPIAAGFLLQNGFLIPSIGLCWDKKGIRYG
jgi:hypothetical protein